MYTVIRFSGLDATLVEFGKTINSVIEGAYSGIDRWGGRTSCELSASDNPDDHLTGVLEGIGRYGALLSEAKRRGIAVEIDIAIEPEDYEGRLLTVMQFNSELIRKLAENEIQMTLSIYGVETTSLSVPSVDG